MKTCTPNPESSIQYHTHKRGPPLVGAFPPSGLLGPLVPLVGPSGLGRALGPIPSALVPLVPCWSSALLVLARGLGGGLT